MTNQNKTLQSLTTLVVPIACLPAFSGCSSTESTGENQRMIRPFAARVLERRRHTGPYQDLQCFVQWKCSRNAQAAIAEN